MLFAIRELVREGEGRWRLVSESEVIAIKTELYSPPAKTPTNWQTIQKNLSVYKYQCLLQRPIPKGDNSQI